MNRSNAVLLASVCSVFFFAVTVRMAIPAGGQAQRGKSATLAGVWESKTAQGVSTMLLNADGSGEFNGKELQWTLNQNVLSLSFQGGSTYMYETVLAGNNLTVNSADLKQPIRFTKSGSAAAEPANPLAGGGLAGPATGGKPASGMAAGGKTASASGPEGTWQVQKANGTFTLVLEPGGSGIFNDSPVRWELSQGVLTLRWENGDVFMYNATLTASSLQVAGGNLSAPITFQRAGAAGSGGMAATGGRSSAAGSVSRPAGGGGSSAGPAGRWETPTPDGVISLVLHPDGSGTFGQGPIQWSYGRNVLTLTGPNGNPIPYNVSIGPDAMTLSGEGLDAPISFRRAGGGGGFSGGGQATASGGGFGGGGLDAEDEGIEEGEEGVGVPGQTPGGGGGQGARAGGSLGGGGGSNPQEMAGKWCVYSGSSTGQITSGREQCFTLRPDGTYEYYGASDSTNQFGGVSSQSSDGGTWSVEGSTIVANSRSQGRVVYQLEKKNNKNNDPMLCLDGQCFVTYGQKPPWPY